MKNILVSSINFYRRNISNLSAPKCRYFPTCSGYALEAIEKYGASKGFLLAIRRFFRCHPFSKREAYDPVP